MCQYEAVMMLVFAIGPAVVGVVVLMLLRLAGVR
jgi:hypothetical protein